MQMRNSSERYGLISQLLHWLIVSLIAVQVTTALLAQGMPPGLDKLIMLGRHKSFGMTILVLAAIRLLWRLRDPLPTLPAASRPLEQVLARATHRLLYLLLFALPLSGWVMSAAHNYPVSWFRLFTWPDPVAPDKALGERMETVHEALVYVLAIALALHVLAALRHHYILRDDVLRRMWPRTRLKSARSIDD